uniref:family 16 glycoside hydrolase n=1 Tax=Symmachiella dynata TaxID=2527995 RepID=UPI0030EE4B05
SRPYRDLILRANIWKKDGWHAGIKLRSDQIGYYGLWMVNGRAFGAGTHKPQWVKLHDSVQHVDNLRDGFEWTCAMIGDHLTTYADGKKVLDIHDVTHTVGFPAIHIRTSTIRNLQIMDLTRGPFRPDEVQTDRVSTITRPVLPEPTIPTPDEPVPTGQSPKVDEDHDSLLPLPPKVAHDPEFLNVFNGKDLTGWVGNVADFKAEDGKLVYSGRLKGRLTTKRKFQDFILRFDFRLESGADNGIGIRQSFDAPFAPKGIEIQILDEEFPKYKNINKPSQHNGSIFDYAAAKQGHLKPLGEWNSQEIICRGNHIVVNLNGTTILDTTIDPGKDTPAHLKHPWGTIALLGSRGRTEFCNIRIKDLGNPAAAAPAKKISFANPMPATAVAHWVFSQGGSVSAMQNERIFKPLTSASQLPRGAYTVILASLIGKSQITDSDLTRFANLPLFKTLDVGSTGVTDDGMAVVGSYRKLCTLGLVGTEVTDRGLSKLAGLTLLQSLLLRGTNISDEGMQALQNMRNMQFLELSTETGNFSDQGVLYLGRMINLQHLAISGGTISDAGLELIAKFPQLERLYISNHMITDKGLKHLRQIPKLNRLHIGGNFGVTDIGLIQLAKLKNLTSLEVGSNPNITDVGLKQLGRMRNLSTLVLDNNLNVTDAGLVHLQKLKKLSYLGLRHTSVTEQGAKALKAKLPQCRIYYGFRQSLK